MNTSKTTVFVVTARFWAVHRRGPSYLMSTSDTTDVEGGKSGHFECVYHCQILTTGMEMTLGKEFVSISSEMEVYSPKWSSVCLSISSENSWQYRQSMLKGLTPFSTGDLTARPNPEFAAWKVDSPLRRNENFPGAPLFLVVCFRYSKNLLWCVSVCSAPSLYHNTMAEWRPHVAPVLDGRGRANAEFCCPPCLDSPCFLLFSSNILAAINGHETPTSLPISLIQ